MILFHHPTLQTQIRSNHDFWIFLHSTYDFFAETPLFVQATPRATLPQHGGGDVAGGRGRQLPGEFSSVSHSIGETLMLVHIVLIHILVDVHVDLLSGFLFLFYIGG